jgi:hypothetical protein
MAHEASARDWRRYTAASMMSHPRPRLPSTDETQQDCPNNEASPGCRAARPGRAHPRHLG